MDGFKIVEVILGVLSTIGALLITAHQVQNYNNNKLNKNLKSLRRLLEKIDEISNSKKYIKDLELSTVSFLKGFSWTEATAILERNIGLNTIIELRNLKKNKMIKVYGNHIYIPSKKYVYKKYLMSFKSWIVGLGFLIYVTLFLIMTLFNKLNFIQYASMFAFMMVFEVAIIYHFNALISYRDLVKSDDYYESKVEILDKF